MDGVLVDARHWHWLSFNQALKIFGFGMSEVLHEERYDGLPTHTKLEMLEKDAGLSKALHPMIRKLKAEFTSRLVEQNCKPSYDKILMLKELNAQGYKLGCCSNATTKSVNIMLEKSHLIDFFNIVYGNTSGFPPKPDPSIYLAAMEELGVLPEETLIIEDSPHGVKAAVASGAHVIRVDGYSDVNSVLIQNFLKSKTC